MAKNPKVHTIISRRWRTGSECTFTGTLEELLPMFECTLATGASYQHEKGNKKINRNPKTIGGLITNLNNATNNAAANGCSSTSYSLKEA